MSVELSVEIPSVLHDRILAVLELDSTLSQDTIFINAIMKLLVEIEDA